MSFVVCAFVPTPPTLCCDTQNRVGSQWQSCTTQPNLVKLSTHIDKWRGASRITMAWMSFKSHAPHDTQRIMLPIDINKFAHLRSRPLRAACLVAERCSRDPLAPLQVDSCAGSASGRLQTQAGGVRRRRMPKSVLWRSAKSGVRRRSARLRWPRVKNMETPKWVPLVNGNNDSNLRSPGALILTHTLVNANPRVRQCQAW